MIEKILAGACVALVLLLGLQTYRLGEVQKDLLAEKASYSEAVARSERARSVALAEANKINSDLQESYNAERKTLRENVSIATADADALRKRLRNATANLATARLINSTGVGEAGNDGDRTVLYEKIAGQDVPATYSEIDIDEAHRAEIIRLNLLSCYKQYDEVRAKVNAFTQ